MSSASGVALLSARAARVVTLALVLLTTARAAEPVPDEAAPPLDRPLRLRLLAPFASPRNSSLYSGFGLPPLREAASPGEGVLTGRWRGSMTHTADSGRGNGRRHRMDGLYTEHSRFDLSLAVHERLLVWADLRFAGWDERRDVFRIYGRDDDLPVLEGEAAKLSQGRATGRHENLAQAAFGALVTWWQADDGVTALGTSVLLKLPAFRRADLTNSGTFDAAFTAHGSLLLLEGVALHGQVGVVLPVGYPSVFEVPSAFRVEPFLQGALGLTWAPTDRLALGLSFEAAQSPWTRQVEFLDRPAFTLSGGVRLRLGRFLLELGAGAGLTSGSADWLAWLELGYASPPLW